MLKIRMEGKISVVFFRESEMIVAYAPALDLSTCGNTIKRAYKNFNKCLKIYLEETIKHGTLEQDLLKLGWECHPKNLTITPPKERYKSIPVNILKKVEIGIPIHH